MSRVPEDAVQHNLQGAADCTSMMGVLARWGGRVPGLVPSDKLWARQHTHVSRRKAVGPSLYANNR